MNCMSLKRDISPVSPSHRPRYFQYRRATDFPALEAVLRLSTKYQAAHLRQACLSRIMLDFPSTLKAWDTRERIATDDHARYTPRDFFPLPILALELACEYRIAEILPAAFYDLSRYRPEKTPSITDAPKQVPPTYSASPAMMKSLTSMEKVLAPILHGREMGIQYMPKFIQEHVHRRSPSAGCLYRQDKDPGRPCRDAFYIITHVLRRSISGEAGGRDADPLHTLTFAVDILGMPEVKLEEKKYAMNPCEPCKVEFTEVCTKARETIWSLLPVWFGLER